MKFSLDFNNRHYKFLKYYLMFLIFFSSLFIPNYLFLINLKEFLDFSEMFKLFEKKSDGAVLFGSALVNHREYKKYSYLQLNPKITVIGSSRVLQFRKNMFSTSFYNMGSSVKSIQEGIDLLPIIFSGTKPEIILFGVDFWWFNDRYIKPNYSIISKPEENKIDITSILKPFEWLSNKKITPTHYIKTIFNNGAPHIGVKANIDQTGIGRDGSYYYTKLVNENDKDFVDLKFTGTKSRIELDQDYFSYNSSPSSEHIKKFYSLIKIIENQEMKVILFFPPLAPEIITFMKNYNYDYIPKLKLQLENLGLKIYDFTDPSNLISSNNCEFYDGYHPGDVVSAKILKYLSAKESTLKEFVNMKNLQEIISANNGLAAIPNKNISQKSEIDFLGIGCKKSLNS